MPRTANITHLRGEYFSVLLLRARTTRPPVGPHPPDSNRGI